MKFLIALLLRKQEASDEAHLPPCIAYIDLLSMCCISGNIYGLSLTGVMISDLSARVAPNISQNTASSDTFNSSK